MFELVGKDEGNCWVVGWLVLIRGSGCWWYCILDYWFVLLGVVVVLLDGKDDGNRLFEGVGVVLLLVVLDIDGGVGIDNCVSINLNEFEFDGVWDVLFLV